MAEFVLKTTNLTKDYAGKKAVDDVSMQIERGSIYGFIGKNGAGKTTLMRMVCGLAAPTLGGISLFGNADPKGHAKERGKIGSMIEMPSLYLNLTAADNLEVQRRILGYSKAGCINETLALVDLANTGKKKVKQFSLGMKQRLGMAVALLGNPEFLILDEPINGMDPVGITEVRETLLSLARDRGITILISSHILTELHHLATHYGIIHDGRLIKQVTAQELNDECKHFTRLVTDDKDGTEDVLRKHQIRDYVAFQNGAFRINDDIDSKAVVKSLVEAGVGVREISQITQNLESYFLTLIGGSAA